jgi:flagellar basal body L-ring protein FlgH
MGRRQKIKKARKIKDITTLEAAIANEASRKRKIEILKKLGYEINIKANSQRVEKKVSDAAFEAGEYLNKFDKQRKAANRRKRARQRRAK